jgi:hypothetical protein
MISRTRSISEEILLDPGADVVDSVLDEIELELGSCLPRARQDRVIAMLRHSPTRREAQRFVRNSRELIDMAAIRATERHGLHVAKPDRMAARHIEPLAASFTGNGNHDNSFGHLAST